MGLGPIEASRQALARAGMTIDDIDLVEINEAFAAQVIPSAKHLGIPWDKLNVHGGAIALGHPFGMTGARIMTTLIHGLQDADKHVRPRDDVRRRRPGHGHDHRAPELTVPSADRVDRQQTADRQRRGMSARTTDGLAGVVAAGPHTYCSLPAAQLGEREPVVRLARRRSPSRSSASIVEPGLSASACHRLTRPWRSAGIVEQVGAVEAQLDAW